MRRSSRAGRCDRTAGSGVGVGCASYKGDQGFTLTELLIATAVMSLVLTSICGIYFTASGEWEREQGEAAALTACSLACSRLADYISQATSATVGTRFTAKDTLALNMPSDSSHGNVYTPVWTGGKVQYRSGAWLLFYLSNSGGSHETTGDILWAATLTPGATSWTVTPDRSWSMYYNTDTGRVAPLTSLSFSLDSSGDRPAVTVTVVSTHKIRGTSRQIRMSRTVCLRNAN